MRQAEDQGNGKASRRSAAEGFWAALGGDDAAPSASSDATAVELARQRGLDASAIDRALATAAGWTVTEDLSREAVSAAFLERIPIAYARRHAMVGLASDGDVMPLALASLSSLPEADAVSRLLGRPVRPVLARREQVLRAINEAYGARTGQADAFIERLDAADRSDVLDEVGKLASGDGREDLLDVASRAPVIKLVNLVLFEAVKLEASDVHIQPYEDRLVIRMRIDGVLFDAYTLPKALLDEATSRVKVMGRMNIAEKRLPQDGRATVAIGDRAIDLRISSVPTSFGERVVIRLLDKSVRLYDLTELGMDAWTLERFRSLIAVEHGLILVTGPTGSGKSTTLYAALRRMDSKQRNVITLEDPIEYQLEGISQMQVSDKKGMTFSSGLRSVLRQDPDVIMVGEIRDRETATMAIQSALTGHLVFSTLHTNDAASAVTRLLDLGIEPYLVASSVVGVLAQRLVRRVCEACGEPLTEEERERARLDFADDSVDLSRMRVGRGCASCRHTGYRGRAGIFELLVVDDEVRKLVQTRATAAEVKAAAAARGMRTLRDQGLLVAASGGTTLEEVARVTMRATV